jgi:hypothetical protein
LFADGAGSAIGTSSASARGDFTVYVGPSLVGSIPEVLPGGIHNVDPFAGKKKKRRRKPKLIGEKPKVQPRETGSPGEIISAKAANDNLEARRLWRALDNLDAAGSRPSHAQHDDDEDAMALILALAA